MPRPDDPAASQASEAPGPVCGNCDYFQPRQGFWQRLLLSAGRGDCVIHERPTRSEHSCSSHVLRRAGGAG